MMPVRWSLKPTSGKENKTLAASFNPITERLKAHRDFDRHAQDVGVCALQDCKLDVIAEVRVGNSNQVGPARARQAGCAEDAAIRQGHGTCLQIDRYHCRLWPAAVC